ncbi:MAG: hypothetical protein ACP59X_16800 [Solidesulfovibrio sp. DCME]|uniref:hypothetical protein n=1 Tax=Solidesulfovibrio sp. DCME TaxID=3447380 RepID=UPI003D13CD12
MKPLLLCALAFAILGPALTGCGPLKPASPSMFYGNCITPPGSDPCDSDMDMCQLYENVITQKFATSGACRTACNQVADQLYYQGYQLRDCGYMIDRGTSLCEQECLRQYPKPQ